MRCFLSILLGGCLLVGCAGDPSVRDTSLLVQGQARTERLNFVYRISKLRVVSSHSYGTGGRITDTGVEEFGKLLVEQAPGVFARRGVTVEAAVQVDGGAAWPDLPRTHRNVAPVLVISLVEGRVYGNTASTRASHVFSAQLLDPASRRLLWKGSIDTAAWIGQDFIMKHVEPKTYDTAQADKLLTAVAEKLAEDGLIR